MIDLLTDTSFEVLQNLIQLAVGLLVGLLLLNPIKSVGRRGFRLSGQIAVIAGASLVGMMLPLNTFGVLPIFLVFVKSGFDPSLIVPSVLSNFLFNMLVPFNSPDFVWRTGYLRVILAFLIGAVGGLLLIPMKTHGLIRIREGLDFYGDEKGLRSIPASISRAVGATGVYLLCGGVLETVFRRYVLFNVTSQVFSNQRFSHIPVLMTRFNVVNPVFLLAVDFLYAVLNFSLLAALLSVFRIRSFAAIVCFNAACLLLLFLSMFF